MRPESILVPGLRRSGMVLVLALAACTVGPDYQRPTVAMPAHYAQAADAVRPAAADSGAWWQTFDDPLLDALVRQAASQNLDVVQAEARLRQARAEAAIAGAQRYPSLRAGGNAERNRISENGQIPIGRLPGAQVIQTLYTAGFDASWEIDLFGHVRRTAEAAAARGRGAEAAVRGARLSVEAEIVADYFEFRGAQQKLAVLAENRAIAEKSLALTQQRRAVGDLADVDVGRARSEVAAIRAQQAPLAAALSGDEYRLELLLGLSPGSLQDRLAAASTVPAVLAPPPAGLPSELLRRRPDIAQAESALQAATADVGVAIAEQFPRFALVGSLGQQANGKSDFLASASRYWSLGPTVSVPLFEGGALAHQVDARKAARDAAVAGYRQSVLAALADAETAFARDGAGRDHTAALADQLASAQAVLDQQQQRYAVGDAPLADLLDAQRQRNQARLALLDAQVEACRDRVALYKALGGGWPLAPMSTTDISGAP